MLAMLVGTDYSGGVKGIGPKKALALILKHKTEKVFAEAKWDEHNNVPWQEVYETFTKMPTTDDYDLEGKEYNKDKVYDFLMNRGFSPDRVKKTLESLPDTQQKRLGDW
jgi:flap endonuclease-1